MRKGAKRFHPSMIRSYFKRKGMVNTKPIFDPFIGKLVYLNRNGRMVVKNGQHKDS